MASFNRKNVRYNILLIIVYVIGIVLIVQLFNLQIVHGNEYLEQANSRLTRENEIKAARGEIYDCNGNLLAGNEIKYSLKIYRSKIEEDELNRTILNAITVLECNKDEYIDSFPITIDPIEYKYKESENIKKWLKNNQLDENLSATEAIEHYIKEYDLAEYSLEDARKILSVRYGMQQSRIYKYNWI